MKLKQLSLFLENKPGALSRPLRLLARAGFNLLTLSLADAQEFGILRLIMEDWAASKALLERNGLVVKLTDVVAAEVVDQPGGLAKILAAVEKEGINVEYMYAFAVRRANKAVLVFCFNDPDLAVMALRKSRVNVVGLEELLNLLAN